MNNTTFDWSILSALWQSGRYATPAALHRESVRLFGESASPTLVQLKRRMDRDQWPNPDAVEESREQSESQKTASAVLDELGMSLVRSMELLVDMAEGPHRDYDRLRGIIDGLADQIRAGGDEVDEKAMRGAFKDLSSLYQKGCRLSLEAIKLIGEYRGAIGKASAKDTDASKPLDDKTPEEIKVEIDRLIGSMAHRYVESQKKNTGEPDSV